MIPLKTKVIFSFLLSEARGVYKDNGSRYLALSLPHSKKYFSSNEAFFLLLNFLIFWCYSLKYFY